MLEVNSRCGPEDRSPSCCHAAEDCRQIGSLYPICRGLTDTRGRDIRQDHLRDSGIYTTLRSNKQGGLAPRGDIVGSRGHCGTVVSNGAPGTFAQWVGKQQTALLSFFATAQ
ncbi:hypothetical protein NDU88_004058 [Pleurodeles waltl]|uniref:Uncharacterized protein n=1 Tax=Pleurodeles waltl TaxID=8319 RepID=A0AAV7W709_PLEWA|nr:hypothetical protein NDU88_004058 [Pleurodeles waltl]